MEKKLMKATVVAVFVVSASLGLHVLKETVLKCLIWF